MWPVAAFGVSTPSVTTSNGFGPALLLEATDQYGSTAVLGAIGAVEAGGVAGQGDLLFFPDL